VQTIAKITAADYPDLLAAVADGISQRELARRYGCAPSLIARHVAKATRARELGDLTEEPALDLNAQPRTGSMRELLEARIRDPRTSARDLASLTNALARLHDEEQRAPGLSIEYLRRGTLIFEPGPRSGPEPRYRLMMRVPGGIDHVSGTGYNLTPREALFLLICAFGSFLGLTREDILGTTAAPAQ